MHVPAAHQAIHARLHPRQGQGRVPVGPAVMPQATHDASFSLYFTTGTGAATASAAPTATALLIDSSAILTPAFPSPFPNTHTPLSSSTANSKSITSNPITSTAVASSSVASEIALPTAVVDPFKQVYVGMTLEALHSHSPYVIRAACGGVVLLVLITAYCFICRWYYKRLPRSTARWDIDDRARKELVYGDQANFTPSQEEKQSPATEDDRRGVPVGDSYFPQGETWRKFEGRTARHPESFIYAGYELHDEPGAHSPRSPRSPGTPPISIAGSNGSTGLPRPRPRFAHGMKRGQIDSVFSTVSFPTTHRADSIRESNFFPDGFEPYEHDGEVWDLASPGFVAGDAPRASMDSTARSVSVNRASIFGNASARARGSVVVYDSEPVPTRSSMLDDDPFAGAVEGNGSAYVYPAEKYSGKRSFDGGKRSMDGHHTHTKPRDIRALGTLVEDADEDARDGKTTPIPRL
ncbi:hypothetical protein FRC09_011807 [Ceratobasidium sp. 395]|nr:hypothetical protein FRC09_011807 [Ceratobasidium sp. 395]